MAAQSKRNDQVLIRSPLNEAFGREEPPTSLYSNSFPQRHYPQNTRLQRMHPGRFPKNSFFARNNPHPGRVTHIKGLLDAPICCVQDGMYDGHRLLLSDPVIDPRLLETGIKPIGATRYSANKDKQVPAVGIVPVTFAWRDELERMTKQVVANAAMGQPPGKRNVQSRQGSRMQSRNGKRQQQDSFLSGLNETTLLELLCRILRTDSIPAIQAWLSSAPEAEKNIVLNMLGMAASGELAYSPSSRDVSQAPGTRPSSQQVQYYYQWEPRASQVIHEPESKVEDGETLERSASARRDSAKRRAAEQSHAVRWLRSQSGSRPGTNAGMETDLPVEAVNQPPSRLNKSASIRPTTAPVKSPPQSTAGVQMVTRSQSGSRKSRFKFVSTWTGANETVPEES